jgi:hypothetical protein
MYLCEPSLWHFCCIIPLLGFLVVLQIWRDLFLSVSLAYAGGRGEVVSLERGCWSEGGGSAILPRLYRWETAGLCPRQHGDVPRSTCHSDMCLVACSRLFIDSQSLVGDGAFLDLAMVEARRLFRCMPWQRWSWAAADGFGGCMKP